MNVIPQGSRLYVEKIVESAKGVTDTGVTFEDEDFKAPQSLKAKVLAIGEYVDAISVGDVILVSQFAPTEVKLVPGDKGKYIIPSEDVLAVIVGSEKAE